jgi:hypothetical protein
MGRLTRAGYRCTPRETSFKIPIHDLGVYGGVDNSGTHPGHGSHPSAWCGYMTL